MTPDHARTIGIVGVGELGSALVRGLLAQPRTTNVLVSPRSRERVCSLGDDPRLRRCASNTELVAAADVICLTVRPPQVYALAEELPLRPGQTIVSFAAAVPLRHLRGLFPRRKVLRGLALPFVREGCGPVVIFPNDADVSVLLSGLGTFFESQSEAELEALFTAGGLMSTYERLAQVTRAHLEVFGVPEIAAKQFVAAMQWAMAERMLNSDSPPALAEYETAGGLNWRCRSFLDERGWFETYRDALRMLDDSRAEIAELNPCQG